jgi:site-specific DNA-methyltransferase (adenine-specific)
MNEVHYSSKNQEWETPQEFFDVLNKEFHFAFDVCASKDNTKCKAFYDVLSNGLVMTWPYLSCWCNPPYGREIGKWVKKAYEHSQISPNPVVCLLPARTDTKWWHDYIMQADEIRFVRGRLTFSNAESPAPFPSCVVVFRSVLDRKHGLNVPVCSTMKVR